MFKTIEKKDYGLIFRFIEEEPELIYKNKKIQLELEKYYKNSDNNFNILIEGENYFVLNLLLKDYRNKIDIIYIDPPYNTKSNKSFYNDKKNNNEWLSFMYRRLMLARELLSDDGIIFISIDDKFIYELKLLLDEIFGRNNYLKTIYLKRKPTFGFLGLNDLIVTIVEQVLIYTKNKQSFNKIRLDKYNFLEIKDINNLNYKYIIKDFGKKYQINSFFTKSKKEVKIYKYENFKIDKIKKLTKDFILENYNKIFYIADTRHNFILEISKSLNNDLYSLEYQTSTGKHKNNNIEVFLFNNKKICWLKDYVIIKDNKLYKKEKLTNLWDDFYLSSVNKEGGISFNYGKKPLKLLKRLINLHPNKNALVLDFFAGSGTTGQAVWELNKEDGGNRQFILVQNDENNICQDITLKRLLNVIENENLLFYKTTIGDKNENKIN